MKYILTVILVLLISINFECRAQEVTNILNLKLTSLENKKVDLSEIKNSKATAFVFLLTDCPASQNYTLTINKLFQKYSNKNIQINVVFPDTYSSLVEITQFKNEYKLKMPVLLDPELKLTKTLYARVAPSCYLLDKTGKIIYEGRIDDWYYSPGRKRTVIRSNDLDNAIDHYLNGLPIDPIKTTPVGCIINY